MGGFGSGVWPRIGCKAKTGERLAFDIRYWKRQGWLRCGRMSFSDGAVVDVIPTVRLDDDLKERLEGLAEATQRTKSFLATEAIREYLDLNEWQIQETRAALAEADAGDFASGDEIRAVTTKWNVDAG